MGEKIWFMIFVLFSYELGCAQAIVTDIPPLTPAAPATVAPATVIDATTATSTTTTTTPAPTLRTTVSPGATVTQPSPPATPNVIVTPNTTTNGPLTTSPPAPTPTVTTAPAITTAPGTTRVTTETPAASMTTTTTVSTPVNLGPNMMFACSGTDPNWHLDMTGAGMHFSAPTITSNFTPTPPISTVGAMQGSVLVYTTATHDSRPATVVITKNDMGCRSAPGGSSKIDVFVVLPNKVFVGCCVPK